MVLQEMADQGHGQVTQVADDEADLRAIVATHDTTPGPGLGGTRLRPYGTERPVARTLAR